MYSFRIESLVWIETNCSRLMDWKFSVLFSSFFRYCRFLARYSGLVLVSISTLSVIAIICSLTLHQLPDFTDPQAVSDRYQKHFIFISKGKKRWIPTDLDKIQFALFFSFAVFLYILQLQNYFYTTIVILLTFSWEILTIVIPYSKERHTICYLCCFPL